MAAVARAVVTLKAVAKKKVTMRILKRRKEDAKMKTQGGKKQEESREGERMRGMQEKPTVPENLYSLRRKMTTKTQARIHRISAR